MTSEGQDVPEILANSWWWIAEQHLGRSTMARRVVSILTAHGFAVVKVGEVPPWIVEAWPALADYTGRPTGMYRVSFLANSSIDSASIPVKQPPVPHVDPADKPPGQNTSNE